jgi:hypothetical protein
MADHVTLHLEDSVRGQESQDSTERVGVSAGSGRKVGNGSRVPVQRVRDSEIGDHMQAARQAIATSDVAQRLEWI